MNAPIMIGSNLGPQPVRGMTIQRYYNGWLNTLPWVNNGGVMTPEWPAGNILKCVSIQPPPRQLLAGELDADILQFIAGAPAGSMLTTWHEAEGQGYPGIDAPTMRAIHARMLALTRDSDVAYGCDNCGCLAANVLWDIPGLDFYGIDIYDAVNYTIGFAAEMNRFVYNVSNRQPNPTIAVLECNSHIPARRPYAFAALYAWLRSYQQSGGNSLALLSYWNPGGGLSGPWLPGDAMTISTLEAVIEDAATV